MDTSDLGRIPLALPRTEAEGPAAPPPSRVWLWFVAVFAFQWAAWIAWFVIASQHQVQEVPLAPRVSAPSADPGKKTPDP